MTSLKRCFWVPGIHDFETREHFLSVFRSSCRWSMTRSEISGGKRAVIVVLVQHVNGSRPRTLHLGEDGPSPYHTVAVRGTSVHLCSDPEPLAYQRSISRIPSVTISKCNLLYCVGKSDAGNNWLADRCSCWMPCSGSHIKMTRAITPTRAHGLRIPALVSHFHILFVPEIRIVGDG